MDYFSLIGLAVVSTILIIVLKKQTPEFAITVSVITGSILFYFLLKRFSPIYNELDSLFKKTGVDIKYFTAAFKALGICYITKFAADICNDFGQSSLAGKIELTGKIVIVSITIPLLRGIIEAATVLIG
ncbi:MAG: stage III sporulation protein AD [bacterium]|nr:stage III sporulation protein AD [bacterium]